MEEFMMFFSVILIIFGVLQIILFFKIWGMTNNVKELKDLYAIRSKELSSSINALASVMKDSNCHKDNKPVKEKKESIRTELVETCNIKTEAPIQELPIIDENSDEYKQRLRKWKVLKGKGFTEQAIREYLEYTKRDMDAAIEFINSL